MNTLKAILVGVLSLILAVALALGLTIGLLSIEYQSDPMLLVATSFVGFWMLFCSFYFKPVKIRQGALALLGFSFLGLIAIGV